MAFRTGGLQTPGTGREEISMGLLGKLFGGIEKLASRHAERVAEVQQRYEAFSSQELQAKYMDKTRWGRPGPIDKIAIQRVLQERGDYPFIY